jgi:hypothetical protein
MQPGYDRFLKDTKYVKFVSCLSLMRSVIGKKQTGDNYMQFDVIF